MASGTIQSNYSLKPLRVRLGTNNKENVTYTTNFSNLAEQLGISVNNIFGISSFAKINSSYFPVTVSGTTITVTKSGKTDGGDGSAIYGVVFGYY